jgi:hypothetical protein
VYAVSTVENCGWRRESNRYPESSYSLLCFVCG